ncbi:MAG: hypothetical protein A2744_01325 [Candidatus Buchananbacteria bacterium RIFCSPHIGHO2_01_FULL_44_11]|uniref:GtrA/DPMS transmembrane domain-containing protein n=1 Tax=Candidatus Buchananbacteria bacterium RIFCSPHIGHO2_01_FULL_44_11 TaxID=1797535 RepID=A0A1G1XYM1_9BACT|nr:MAG: hypothetical protein A2744_01325 [Candidatus Buchananbacteria bacterium RIFCSPHIGHO2_01_FULL_44_11]
MLDRLIKTYQKNKRFIVYCLIGFTGVSLDFFIFYLLNNQLGIYYQYANVISVSLGIANNFVLNAFFNFKMLDKFFSRFLKFYSIGLLGLATSALCLYLMIEILTLETIVAKILTIFIVTAIQYTLNKKLTFKQA